MKSYSNLWDKFISDENIKLAIRNACKHKTKRKEFRKMKENQDKYAEKIRRIVENYHNAYHTPVTIYDGVQRKKRTIIVPTCIEQVVHHMAVNILKPIILKPLYEHSYGSVPGRGAHLGKKYICKAIKKGGKDVKYVLKMDIRKYFDSVPHDVLKAKIAAKIRDKRFRDLLYEIVDVTETGIPLGFYTSQWIANWYLSGLDHFIKEELKAAYYYRYMDDMVIFGSSKRKLHRMREAISAELEKLGLEMKGNWQVFRFAYRRCGKEHGRDLDFMGFRFFRDRVVLRRSIMMKAARKAARMAKKKRSGGKVSVYECRQILSYLGWIDHTDTYRMYTERVKPFVSVRRMKKRIGGFERRQHAVQDSLRLAGRKAA